MLNPQKIAELRNDPHMKELFAIIEDMKNPPKDVADDPDVADVVNIASELERDVKNIIFEEASESAVPADIMELVEKANALNRLIMDYTEAQKTDNASEMASLLQKIREIGEQFAHLPDGNGKSV